MRIRRTRDGKGWILRGSETDSGLWFDTKESALRWAESMGVTVEEEIR